MSQTIGRIDRTGVINFGDASVSVWEEGISGARAAGGYAGEQTWVRQFKHDVRRRMAQKLRKLGWSTEPMNYIFNGDGNLYCRKGDLRGDLTTSGRTVTLEMFQNVNAPKRPDHGGRYEYDKERLMPYRMRIEMERTRRAIRDYLLNVFTGYTFKPPAPTHGPNGLTALDYLRATTRGCWHYKEALGRRGGEEYSYNNRSADGAVVKHGERVWFADRKGRVCTGTAFYNINNMWWVVSGRYDFTNMGSFELYTKPPENIRIRRNASLRRKRLEGELGRAVQGMNFERAAQLRDILFPGAPALFNVWHDEHKLFHCSGFSGYTSDQSKAGKFTVEEVRGWEHAPNKVCAIEQRAAV